MCLLYPPTCSILEEHLDVTPFIDLDVQLVTNLMLMMEKSCPDHLVRHRCYEFLVTYLFKHLWFDFHSKYQKNTGIGGTISQIIHGISNQNKPLIPDEIPKERV